MARTAIAVQEIQFLGSGAIAFTAADATNGMMFPNDGRTVLLIKNGGAGAITVTVTSVPDEYGRTGDLIISVAAGEERIVGPLRPALFNQRSGADQGTVYVGFSAATSVTVAAPRLNL